MKYNNSKVKITFIRDVFLKYYTLLIGVFAIFFALSLINLYVFFDLNHRLDIRLGDAVDPHSIPVNSPKKIFESYLAKPSNIVSFVEKFVDFVNSPPALDSLGLHPEKIGFARDDIFSRFRAKDADQLKLALGDYLSTRMVNLKEVEKRVYPRNYPILIEIDRDGKWSLSAHSKNKDSLILIYAAVRDTVNILVSEFNSLRKTMLANHFNDVASMAEVFDKSNNHAKLEQELFDSYNKALNSLVQLHKNIQSNQSYVKIAPMADILPGDSSSSQFGMIQSQTKAYFIRLSQLNNLNPFQPSEAKILDEIGRLLFELDFKSRAIEQFKDRTYNALAGTFSDYWKANNLVLLPAMLDVSFQSERTVVENSIKLATQFIVPNWTAALIFASLISFLTFLTLLLFEIAKRIKNDSAF
jgi:hypothetical protein